METFYLQLTAGRGPRECSFVVARLLEIVCSAANTAGLRCKVIVSEPDDGPRPVAFSSATICLEGERAEELAKKWVGTIQWIGTSPYRPDHKRKNWFIRIAPVPVPSKDLGLTGKIAIETMRATGPGGQNVNKTNSAVRATHVASGLSVTSRETRSQVQNRKLAHKKLEGIYFGMSEDRISHERNEKWSEHQRVERGNPKRIFQGEDFIEV